MLVTGVSVCLVFICWLVGCLSLPVNSVVMIGSFVALKCLLWFDCCVWVLCVCVGGSVEICGWWG